MNPKMKKFIWIGLACLWMLSTSGCFIRRGPPIRFIPVIGHQTDYSMEGIVQRALKDKNPTVRMEAVKLLGTMISTPEEQVRSATGLGRALKDEERSIRLEAVRALGNIDPAISGPYLSSALTDEDVLVRVQVIQELREAYQRQSNPVGQVAGGQ